MIALFPQENATNDVYNTIRKLPNMAIRWEQDQKIAVHPRANAAKVDFKNFKSYFPLFRVFFGFDNELQKPLT